MARSGDDRLEQRLDRWVEAGRQFVDGVSGARPGSRSAPRRGAPRLNPGELGRWVENKLEWLLDDEADDDWREPWQQRMAGPRRRLEARSRRPLAGPEAAPAPVSDEQAQDWPDDALFSVPRWQRQQPPAAQPGSQQQAPGAPRQDRPLPRSSRRR